LPGKQPDYLSYIRNDLLPVMKKAKDAGKIAGFAVALRGVGAALATTVQTIVRRRVADLSF
jgi:hypothetical protein